MKIRNIGAYGVLIIGLILSLNQTNAIEIKILPANNVIIESKNETEITRKDFFKFLSDNFKSDLPKTYKYINLKFKDIGNDEKLKEYIQILVYLDIIENKEIKLFPGKQLNAYTFYNFLDKELDLYAIPDNETENDLRKRNTKIYDINNVSKIIKQQNENIEDEELEKNEISNKKKIFTNVYDTLLESHYDKDKLTEENLINSAIEGLTKGTEDKYTTYFPPSENKDFEEDLNGKYEGIGAYVDMETPGEFKIISAISGTPAEKAGLKGGDRVLKVNGKEITKENSLNEVVSWIKGPAGTKVKLNVKRGEEIFDVEIKRAKIIIKEVEYKSINNKVFYIQIKTFGNTVKQEFEIALNELKNNTNTNTVIIDLRNNPGGYLDQVTEMLGFFVEEGEATAVIKYKDYKTTAKSKGYDLIDFSKYKIILLQNSGTASASEIMIGTIKDYYPEAKIIGEKSYGKGSVQTIKPYNDGSALKYTIAKWFTGKTETGIDQIGIIPDIELILDEEKYKEGYDNQLQKAIELSK
ncbi:PDZ domain-containing protein [Candidatus Gracilibacteria bacterium]|nr:PDZ domain-containing protein [Candidatus Gracilibacteria bacterium]